MLSIHRFVRGPLPNNVYVLADEQTGRCAIVDPSLDSEDIWDWIQGRGWHLELILNTHAHFDHIYTNGFFAQASGAPIALHRDDLETQQRFGAVCINWGVPLPEVLPPTPTIVLEHGKTMLALGHEVEVRHTPGHSPGQVAFVWPGHCVSGDTLFQRGVGRWDLPGASYEQLEQSIIEQLYTLPDETVVYPGHGELTSIGEEKRLNPYVGAGARFVPKL